MPLRYEDRTLKELHEIAARKSVKGHQTMRKAQLISSLRGNRKLKYPLLSSKKISGRSDKYERCVQHVKSKNSRYNPYAICQASVYGH